MSSFQLEETICDRAPLFILETGSVPLRLLCGQLIPFQDPYLGQQLIRPFAALPLWKPNQAKGACPCSPAFHSIVTNARLPGITNTWERSATFLFGL